MPFLLSLMTSAELTEILRSLSEQPMLLVSLIILTTFILEDAATIAAALLAAEGYIDPYHALTALFVGITIGDIGLYILGRYASNHPGAIRWAGERRLKRGRDWMHHRMLPALLGARFLPGMRLPTYIASGFLKLSFPRFAMIAVVAVALWTTIIFSAVYNFGAYIIDTFGNGSWLIGVALVLIAVFLPKRLENKRDDGEND